jgi:hypothetical protein
MARGGERSGSIAPDRSATIAPAAQDALERILVAGSYDRRFDDLDAAATSTLAVLLGMYAEMGRPPSLEEIASATARTLHETDRILDKLHRRDLVLLNPDGSIGGAYPFTEAATAHTVTFPRTGRTLHAMCAIDALGAGAMCCEDAAVRSRCHACGAPILVRLCANGQVLAEVKPRSTLVWAGYTPSCGCLAESLCTELIFCCSDRHLDQWRHTGRGDAGRRLSMEEALQVGMALFVGRASAPAGAADRTTAGAQALEI